MLNPENMTDEEVLHWVEQVRHENVLAARVARIADERGDKIAMLENCVEELRELLEGD